MNNIKYNEDKQSYIIFANNLKRYLKEKKITQAALGEQVGVSQGTVCDWVNCRTYPRMDKVEAMAIFLGIEKSDLIEEHNVNSKYYLEKMLPQIERDLRNNPDLMELLMKMKKLSPHNRETVSRLIDGLIKEDK